MKDFIEDFIKGFKLCIGTIAVFLGYLTPIILIFIAFLLFLELKWKEATLVLQF